MPRAWATILACACPPVTAAAESNSSKIPNVFIIVSPHERRDDLVSVARHNLERLLALNPGFELRWLGPTPCKTLVEELDPALASGYDREVRESYRRDVCRLAALRHGGFSLHPEAQLARPAQELVDADTTFLTAYTASREALSDALLAATPGSEVVRHAVEAWVAHYRTRRVAKGGHGAKMLEQGLKNLMATCDRTGDAFVQLVGLPRWSCGEERLRIYYEDEMWECNPKWAGKGVFAEPKKYAWDRFAGSEACPLVRAENPYHAAKFGLFEPGRYGRVAAWPKMEECLDFDCRLGETVVGLPEGEYRSACFGCGLELGGYKTLLRCTACAGENHKAPEPDLGTRGNDWSLDISPGRCDSPVRVKNLHGQLSCFADGKLVNDNWRPDEPCDGCVPQGEYLETCSGCSVLGMNVLQCARCHRDDGLSSTEAIMRMARCRSPGRIVNRNGELDCEGVDPSVALPDGNYLDSCIDCTQVQPGNIIACTCLGADGVTARYTTYKRARCPPPGQLGNSDGSLVCENVPKSLELPEGSYLDSCTGCEIRKGHLHCQACVRDTGDEVPALYTDLHSRCDRTLSCVDGSLRCDGETV